MLMFGYLNSVNILQASTTGFIQFSFVYFTARFEQEGRLIHDQVFSLGTSLGLPLCSILTLDPNIIYTSLTVYFSNVGRLSKHGYITVITLAQCNNAFRTKIGNIFN
jgi:hypothetical protein